MKYNTAKLANELKAKLKNSFPEFKFSVRSRVYSMGSSIDINWIDGPTEEEVKKITNEFESIDYDEYTGEILSGGNRYVMLRRDFSPENEIMIFNQVKSKYACFDNVNIEDYHNGRIDWEVSRIFRNKLSETSFYSKPSVKPEEPKINIQNSNNSHNTCITVTFERDWTWINFSSKPSEEIREVLKNKFQARFSGKRVAWYITYHVEQSEIEKVLNDVTSNIQELPAAEKENTKNNEENNNTSMPVKTNNVILAEKLKKLADNMQSQIDNKLHPACSDQNYTARRARMAEGMYKDGMRLEKIQKILYALSSEHTEGTINPLLSNLNSKAVIETIIDYSNFMNCKPDSWMNDTRKKLEKYGITYSNYDEIKSLLEAMAGDNREREEAKKRKELENKVKSLIGQIPGFFPTPQNVVKEIVEKARIEEGNSILEPSAGSGAIADVIKENYSNVSIDTIEYNMTLQEFLKVKNYPVIADDFMTYNNGKRFDRIVMNPPFENGQDIDHVKHAYELLKDGGRIVSVMSMGPFFRNDRKATEFRAWFDNVGGYQEELPQGSFRESLTGVATCYVVIDK